ncbi:MULTISPECIES: efflux RND transporter permease subunit [Corallincola]|uniref:RND family transporter n=3 Tax=Corallincola TaxID=1775176 RepID=A0A368NRV4_9GAMM|nr:MULTISPECIES: MMPL family transporter [Corallincola]RCU52663.1 RND family transporter [Corallincola holothuriorum]TAA48156.1 RND family transporter [Corallincola spongiicola]TCI03161.1 RND family transporter [Corallincola luteus]
MGLSRTVDLCELAIFRHRGAVITLFALMTGFLLYQATMLRMDAGFIKNIPLHHPYMKTYMKHQKDFGGANSVLVAVRAKSGDISNPKFFKTLKKVHDQLFFIPGVNRTAVSSVYSPSTRFVEVVEDGFAGGPVIPADFDPDDLQDLEKVRENINKAGIVGRLVSEDFSAAMVRASLLEFNPETGEKLDVLALASQLEEQIRAEYGDDDIDIHIIGFAKMIGDIADGAKSVVTFFAIAFAITAVLVFIFSGSLPMTVLALSCSLVAVVWQVGLLTVLGFGLDPMSILVPFLVFAIGVSHGVQMINSVGRLCSQGMTGKEAAQLSFRRLLVPGGIALLSDTIGFLTILSIDIGIIRELAITASLGVAVIILTNLILLPVLLSYTFKSANADCHTEPRVSRVNWLFQIAAMCADKRVAAVILIGAAVLFGASWKYAEKMQIGDLQAGAPQLHADSRYNQDTFLITEKFSVSVDIITVITETKEEACTYHEYMNAIDEFQWRLSSLPGVQSVVSLPSIAKKVNEGYNEGSARWRTLPFETASLVQTVARVPTSSGLLNGDCSVLPIYIFLKDHKAKTIQDVVDAVKELRREYERPDLRFRLASGPVGVMAAKNEAVSAAQAPMLLYVYSAVIILCLISFRSLRATISVVLPLYVVSTMAQALMTILDIGLTVATLPVIALGVGIGVDYGIYILSTMVGRLSQGVSVKTAYLEALRERGNAVLFTGFTLAIGVSTWFFSALKFQVDMGILLTFMFLVNMLGAIILLPALASFFWPKQSK